MDDLLDSERLCKLLALASSDNDAEALAALRKARLHLDAAGEDFVSLADRLKTSIRGRSATEPRFSGVTGCSDIEVAAFKAFAYERSETYRSNRLMSMEEFKRLYQAFTEHRGGTA